MIELSRVLSLTGIFVLLLLIQGRRGVRRTVQAVGAAVTVIALVALASRFHPEWFTIPVLPEGFSTARLSYPVEYWNGLAALMAIGIAPLAWGAGIGRNIAVRAGSAAAIPVVLAVCYLTASRGGAAAAAAALVILLVLIPARIRVLIGLIMPAVGSVLLFALLDERPELRDGKLGPIASSQGDEMLVATIAVIALVTGAQALLAWFLERHDEVLPEISRGTTKIVGVGAGLLALLLVVVALGSGFLGERWSEFKEPQVSGSTVARLGNLNSGARYEIWKSAIEASESERLTGIGPGTFEYWWAREGDYGQYTRDAHSLYLEFLAETGPVGFLLIVLTILGPIVLAATLVLREGSVGRRAPLAAAAAGMTGFAVAAGVDWSWELTVLPVSFLALAAASVGPAAASKEGRTTSRFAPIHWSWWSRSGVTVLSLLAIGMIYIPYAGEKSIRESQESYVAGDFSAALRSAEDALELQPYSASAGVQKALLLSEAGRHGEAAAAARAAIGDEELNWRNWYALGEVLSAGSRPGAARRARRRAQTLYPNSEVPLDPRTWTGNGGQVR